LKGGNVFYPDVVTFLILAKTDRAHRQMRLGRSTMADKVKIRFFKDN